MSLVGFGVLYERTELTIAILNVRKDLIATHLRSHYSSALFLFSLPAQKVENQAAAFPALQALASASCTRTVLQAQERGAGNSMVEVRGTIGIDHRPSIGLV